MKATINIEGKNISVDLTKPIDISIPLKHGMENPNAWYAPPVDFSPVRTDNFVGSVKEGSPVNFYNVRLNPHGNGTHTESVGHISPEMPTINQCLKQFFFLAHLISVYPTKMENGDRVIFKEQLEELNENNTIKAVIIRTLPNHDTKLTAQYSHTNPPYLDVEAAEFLKNIGIEHLLLDLPSVDREHDEGKLAAHHAFWNYPAAPRYNATISEMVFIPDEVKNGLYLLNLQIPSFELDAAPSKPVLYAIF